MSTPEARERLLICIENCPRPIHLFGSTTNLAVSERLRARGHFPTDEAALKLLFLVLNRTENEWTMPAREWCLAKAQFAILFGERFTQAMA